MCTNCLSVFDHFVGLALKGLTLPRIALKYGQTYFKNLAVLVPYQKRVREKCVLLFLLLPTNTLNVFDDLGGGGGGVGA